MWLKWLSRLYLAERGNVAVIFAVVAVPLVLAAGVALDMMRLNVAHTRLQAAVDSAALAGGAMIKQIDGSLKKNVQSFLSANGAPDLAEAITDVRIVEMDDTTLQVAADAAIPASLLTVAGYDKLAVSAAAEVKRSYGNLDVALVLDNTYSMTGTKLAALKDSGRLLIDTLLGDNAERDQIRVALVPFSRYVNVGLANRSASWLKVDADTTSTSYQCWNTYPDATKSNCRPQTYYNDGVPYQGEVCDWDYGAPVEQCGVSTSTMTWRGCVGSRDYPLDTKDVEPGNTYTGLINEWCPSAVTTLTGDKAALNSAIGGMIAQGDTYIPAGLMWGWNSLSPGEPFSEGVEGRRKAMVLMTDGANTLSPSYPRHDYGDVATANKLTQELCDNIKAADIEIYTIAFDPDDEIKDNVLRNCASSASNYFDARDEKELKLAFDLVSKQLSKLRVAK